MAENTANATTCPYCEPKCPCCGKPLMGHPYPYYVPYYVYLPYHYVPYNPPVYPTWTGTYTLTTGNAVPNAAYGGINV
jgi:hypothetical protein